MPREKQTTDPLAPKSTRVTKTPAKPRRQKVKSPEKTFKSAETVVDSTDEDEEEPAAVNGAKDVQMSEDSDEGESEASDGNSENEEPSPQRAKPAVNGTKKIVAPPTAAPSESEEESSEEEAPARSGNMHAVADARPVKAFKPPGNFKAYTGPDATTAKSNKIFEASKTKGKEIWYISAPASLPMSALQEVALEKFAKQQPIMTHNGAEFALVADPAAKDHTRIMLPDARGDGYQVLRTKVNHVLQFQQVVNLQSTANKGVSKSSTSVMPQVSSSIGPPRRLQPKGLRMKWRPSGFGDGELGCIGSSDDEEAARHSEKVFKKPDITGAEDEGESKEERRRKRKERKAAEAAEAAALEAKNEKYTQEATRAIDADQDTAPPEATSKEAKKKKKKDRHELAVTDGDAGATDRADPDGDVEMVERGDGIETAVGEDEEAPKERKKKKKSRQSEIGSVAGTEATEGTETSEKKEKKKRKKDKEATGDA